VNGREEGGDFLVSITRLAFFGRVVDASKQVLVAITGNDIELGLV